MDSPLVSTEWLAARLEDPDLRILDCSVVMRTAADGTYGFVPGRDEYDAGHVPGSVFVDVLGELADATQPLPMALPSAEQFAAAMSRHGVGDGTRVVLYDRSNHAWAARVWWLLRYFGFAAAAVLDGGWQKWAAEGRTVGTAPGSYASGEFTACVRPDLIATKDRVLASIAGNETTIINSLSPEEHRGEAATRFPRAGRIAGSCNVFCQSLIDPDTKAYRPVTEIRALFEQAGALGSREAITYCGAGIAASSNALALTLIGMDRVAVYDGSLAEWTADPDLPMETG